MSTVASVLKVGRGAVQMHYESCETCGKSRVVSLDNTVGLVPATKSVRTTDRIIRDTCRCKRKRSSHPTIDVAPAKPAPSSKAPTPSPPQHQKRRGSGAPSATDDRSPLSADDAAKKAKTLTTVDDSLSAASVPHFTPRSLRVRLKKVSDGYQAVPAPPISLKILIHHHNGVYIAIPPVGVTSESAAPTAPSNPAPSNAESASTPPIVPITTPSPTRSTRSSASTPSSSPPSSPVNRPSPVLLPNGLTLFDLAIPPWTVMHSEAIHNRTQCEVCGKQGSLICCDRCPSVYHEDCLPRDHVTNVDPWLCPSCLQTPFGQDKACRLCAGDSNLSQIILCDCCDDEYHLYCLNPPLDAVPDGDWFCPVCSSQGHTRRQCLKKKRGGVQKPRPQFSYPSLLQETYEDLTILDRGAWMRPPGLGKQWTADDIRKLTQAQTRARLFRDKVAGRVRREAPSLSKMTSAANVAWYTAMLPDPNARRQLLRLAYSTQLNAEFRIRLPMADRVAAIMRWRYQWAAAEFEVDVFMRLLRVWHELEQTLHEHQLALPPPLSPPHLAWGFGSHRRNGTNSGAPQGGGVVLKERLQLGYDQPDRARSSDLDPVLVTKMAQLRITSPMSVRSILNPF